LGQQHGLEVAEDWRSIDHDQIDLLGQPIQHPRQLVDSLADSFVRRPARGEYAQPLDATRLQSGAERARPVQHFGQSGLLLEAEHVVDALAVRIGRHQRDPQALRGHLGREVDGRGGPSGPSGRTGDEQAVRARLPQRVRELGGQDAVGLRTLDRMTRLDRDPLGPFQVHGRDYAKHRQPGRRLDVRGSLQPTRVAVPQVREEQTQRQAADQPQTHDERVVGRCLIVAQPDRIQYGRDRQHRDPSDQRGPALQQSFGVPRHPRGTVHRPPPEMDLPWTLRLTPFRDDESPI
jgi:hypothetical protein